MIENEKFSLWMCKTFILSFSKEISAKLKSEICICKVSMLHYQLKPHKVRKLNSKANFSIKRDCLKLPELSGCNSTKLNETFDSLSSYQVTNSSNEASFLLRMWKDATNDAAESFRTTFRLSSLLCSCCLCASFNRDKIYSPATSRSGKINEGRARLDDVERESYD